MRTSAVHKGIEIVQESAKTVPILKIAWYNNRNAWSNDNKTQNPRHFAAHGDRSTDRRGLRKAGGHAVRRGWRRGFMINSATVSICSPIPWSCRTTLRWRRIRPIPSPSAAPARRYRKRGRCCACPGASDSPADCRILFSSPFRHKQIPGHSARNVLFYPQLGVKLCSMAGGGVQKIYMVFLREPSRRDRSGSDLFHLRDGFEIKMNFDRNVSCFIFVNALMHDDFFD